MPKPPTANKLTATTLLITGLAAVAAATAPAAHATNGVDGAISSTSTGSVTLSWRVYIPAGSTASCDMAIENSANTAGTYREFEYTAIGGSANYQGRLVSSSLQASAPAGSTAYGEVYCTFLKTGGQATTGGWQGSTLVRPAIKDAPMIPPGGSVG
ncbi:MAG: hypothetical protein H5T78_22285 [Nocardia sp.]|nr:hypothetical protein [Nocardia sp.]